jgi:ABC-type multidrug transport system fused ATPase/permease subunit
LSLTQSVLENITYGYEEAAENAEMIQKAAKLSNAHQFIMDTNEGYKTNVGQAGSQMSGGKHI